MEGLINPYKSPQEIDYTIYKGFMLCSNEGILFIHNEDFKLKEKIKKLDSIIIKVLDKLKDIDFGIKENIIDAITEKQNLLKDILIKYKEIENKYLEYDHFYRQEVFQFYRGEYSNAIMSDNFACKKYLSIGLDIQILLREKFYDFLNNYCDLIDKFIDINNYIIKIKILFNIGTNNN